MPAKNAYRARHNSTKYRLTYHEITYLRKNIIQICREHSTLTNKLISSLMNISRLMNNLYTSIVNYETIQKAENNAYHQQMTSILKTRMKISFLLTDSIDATTIAMNIEINIEVENNSFVMRISVNFVKTIKIVKRNCYVCD